MKWLIALLLFWASVARAQIPTPTGTFPPAPTPTVAGCTAFAPQNATVDEVQSDSNCDPYPPAFPTDPSSICYNDTGICDMTVNKLQGPGCWSARVGFIRYAWTIPPGSTFLSAGFEFTTRNTINQNNFSLNADYISSTTFCSAANWNPSGPGAAGSLPISSITADGVTPNTLPLTDLSGLTDTGTALRLTISGADTFSGSGDVEISNQCGWGGPGKIVVCFATPTGTPPTATPTVTVTETATVTLTPTNPAPATATEIAQLTATAGPPATQTQAFNQTRTFAAQTPTPTQTPTGTPNTPTPTPVGCCQCANGALCSDSEMHCVGAGCTWSPGTVCTLVNN